MWIDVVGLDAFYPFFSFYGFAKLRAGYFEHANSKKILKFRFDSYIFDIFFPFLLEKKRYIDRQMGFQFSVSYMTGEHKDFTASRVFFVRKGTEVARCPDS